MAPSDDGVKLQLSSGWIVLIDPLALDGLSAELQQVGDVTRDEGARKLKALGDPFPIGLHPIRDFRAGWYTISPDDFERTDDSDGPGIFAVDSGSIIVIDAEHLADVARVLTWDRYDDYLTSPVGDSSKYDAIEAEVGGPYFAVLQGSIDRAFRGDGRYRMVASAPKRAS